MGSQTIPPAIRYATDGALPSTEGEQGESGMRRALPRRLEKRPNSQASSDEICFRPGVQWRWLTGATGLIVCVFAVRYLAQHPTISALLIGVPVLCLGGIVMSRAPRVLVRLTSSEVHVVGLFASRRLARDRVRAVQLSGSTAKLVWQTRRGRMRVTRLPGLGGRSGGRSTRGKHFLCELDQWLAC